MKLKKYKKPSPHKRRLLLCAFTLAGVLCINPITGFTQDEPEPEPTPEEEPDPTLIQFDLATATIADMQRAMANKALTSVELVNLYLARIETYDQGGLTGVVFNSVPAVNPLVLEEAAEADRLRAEGIVKGPLHGIPFVSKGNYAVKGLPLTNGLTAWVDMISTRDAFIIKITRDAGAVFLGHANQDAFQSSASSSTSQNWGTVRNAYVTGTTSGGSSGGPATATGSYFTAFAYGGETGGSVRGPADRAGILGYKGSNGVISVDGLAPLAWDRDAVGPMTRYAQDMAYVLDVASQANPDDIWANIDLAPSRPRPTSYSTKLDAAYLAGKKIGIVRNYLSTSNTQPAPQINAHFTQAVADLEAMGVTIVEAPLPSHVSLSHTPRRASIPDSIPEGSEPQRRLYSPTTTDTTGNMVAAARAYPSEKLIESLFVTPLDTPEERLEKIMFWINPVTQISAAQKQAIIDGITFGPEGDMAIEHFEALRYAILDYDNWLAAEGIDFLIFPTTVSKTTTGNTSNGRTPINSYSLPFLTVPMGILENGEPTTLGIMGRHKADDDVLAAAAAYEAYSQKRVVSTLSPPLEGESFSYHLLPEPTPTPVVPPAPNPVVTPSGPATPVITVATAGQITGRGRNARMSFGGVALSGAPIESVTLTVNGQRLPVSVEDDAWSSEVPLRRFRPFVNRGIRTVTVIVQIRDISGNVSAERRIVRLPVAAILRS